MGKFCIALIALAFVAAPVRAEERLSDFELHAAYCMGVAKYQADEEYRVAKYARSSRRYSLSHLIRRPPITGPFNLKYTRICLLKVT
jgi:hypothetical protein